jgi:hypothetical protein
LISSEPSFSMPAKMAQVSILACVFAYDNFKNWATMSIGQITVFNAVVLRNDDTKL